MATPCNITSFPSDLLNEILLKTASSSYADLCRARISSKTLNDISNEKGFNKFVDLISLKKPWVWDQHGRMTTFFGCCLESGNPTSLFLRGVYVFFYEENLQAGLAIIKDASHAECLMATYCHTMLCLTMDGSDEVFNSSIDLSRADAVEMRMAMNRSNRRSSIFGWVGKIWKLFMSSSFAIPAFGN
ncbi:uncharacterized protein LOC112082968 [Eutrema salsugineum]|uniref:uncharacterized protein LOC112082968 n=1 Tax=Eutrema salsugineum TaxID=72664 RepID=UPI000CED4ACE|nr:uncharacterized protein LOC112082968 [Eutrema salsugineum]